MPNEFTHFGLDFPMAYFLTSQQFRKRRKERLWVGPEDYNTVSFKAFRWMYECLIDLTKLVLLNCEIWCLFANDVVRKLTLKSDIMCSPRCINSLDYVVQEYTCGASRYSQKDLIDRRLTLR